jgi:hypothetical protein
VAKLTEACREADTPPPRIQQEPGGLWVEFLFPVLGSATQEITPITGQVTGQVITLLKALQDDMTRGEMMAALHLKHRDSFVDTYLKPAMAEGLIEMTIPDKPNSRLQKYRLTAKGRNCVQVN